MPISLQCQLAKSRRLALLHKPILRALHSAVPVLLTIFVVKAAYAQGTMDFSGATTLMGTFKPAEPIFQYHIWCFTSTG